MAVEHDEGSFDVADVLGLHRRTGVRVVFDLHHHRCNPAPGWDAEEALRACCATWPPGVRPKAHLSSPRTEMRLVRRRARGGGPAREVPVAPRIEQHADFPSPWDLIALLRMAPGPLDVMVEAKAKDLAVLWLREQLARLDPDAAGAEERGPAAA